MKGKDEEPESWLTCANVRILWLKVLGQVHTHEPTTHLGSKGGVGDSDIATHLRLDLKILDKSKG